MRSEKAASRLQEAGRGFDITPTEGGCQIVSHGQAAHASTPWNGVNAASYLVELLSQVFSKEQLGTFFGFIHEKDRPCHRRQPDRRADERRTSGPLTFNLAW